MPRCTAGRRCTPNTTDPQPTSSRREPARTPGACLQRDRPPCALPCSSPPPRCSPPPATRPSPRPPPPTETVTLTVTPSASPSPTAPPADERDAWAQKIESTSVEHHGTWEQQCQEADFPIAPCFIDGLGADGEDMHTVALDLTPEKVPDLEIPFEEYREIQAEESFLSLSHAFRQIDELPARGADQGLRRADRGHDRLRRLRSRRPVGVVRRHRLTISSPGLTPEPETPVGTAGGVSAHMVGDRPPRSGCRRRCPPATTTAPGGDALSYSHHGNKQ